MKTQTMKWILGGLASCAVTGMCSAEPLKGEWKISKSVDPREDLEAVYPAFSDYDQSHKVKVGAESHPAQPAGKDGEKWLFFQTGNGGQEAGLVMNLGQRLSLSEGDSVRVSFTLGAKKGQTFTAPVVVTLTDRPGGRPLAKAEVVPAYQDGVQDVSVVFKDGLKDTKGPLGVTFLFRQDTPQFAQGLLQNIRVAQGTGLEGGVAAVPADSLAGQYNYDGRVFGKEILTPKLGPVPKLTGASLFGVRPGKPIRFCVTATGEKPVEFSAAGLPDGVSIDQKTGWITGRAPMQKGDTSVLITAKNALGSDSRRLTLRVGDEICLAPPMGWNSWYVHSEGVSEQAVRDMAKAMKEKGLQDCGWTYVNIDDCWMGERDPKTKRITANTKFNDMKAMVDFVNSQGLKAGIYSTAWMVTFAGYTGGTGPNEEGDYSKYYLPENERQHKDQFFGRFPRGIKENICEVGPAWFIDRDAQQFAEWGIDFVKYDYLEWDLLTNEDKAAGVKQVRFTKEKREEHGITQRFYQDFRALDRDVVISLSPTHTPAEDAFVSKYSNMWRLTADIHPDWERMKEPFGDELVGRLALTRPGHYGDLDMLQIGPMGTPNQAAKVFKPSRLKPSEQYLQVTLWSILTQPLLLSCNVPTMDDFDLNLVTNTEVLAVNQDPLGKQGYRVKNLKDSWEVWAKDLEDGSKAVALFNLGDKDQVISISAKELGLKGTIRDLWRQKDIGNLKEEFSSAVSPHGAVFLKITPNGDLIGTK